MLTPARLNDKAYELMEDSRNEVYLSAASSWEIAIKVARGKLKLPAPPGEYVPSRLAMHGMSALPIQHVHALHVATLPPHHWDPFDRMLVAQSQVEDLPLLTADRKLAAYDVKIVWAGQGQA